MDKTEDVPVDYRKLHHYLLYRDFEQRGGTIERFCMVASSHTSVRLPGWNTLSEYTKLANAHRSMYENDSSYHRKIAFPDYTPLLHYRVYVGADNRLGLSDRESDPCFIISVYDKEELSAVFPDWIMAHTYPTLCDAHVAQYLGDL